MGVSGLAAAAGRIRQPDGARRREAADSGPQKPGIGPVPHRSVQRPARKSARASSASASKRPAATSSSNWRSHAAASKSANHSRNASSSAGVSCNTARSISLTPLTTPSLPYAVVPHNQRVRPLPRLKLWPVGPPRGNSQMTGAPADSETSALPSSASFRISSSP